MGWQPKRPGLRLPEGAMSIQVQDEPSNLSVEKPTENLIQLEADFLEDGKFGRRVLEVDSDQVKVVESNGATSFQMPIGEIKSARNEPLVGGGRLEVVTKNGEIVPIISYSLTVAAKFSEAARGIEQLAKSESLSINLKQEKLRCSKCNRLLPEKDGVCPACVNRGKTLLRISKFLLPISSSSQKETPCSHCFSNKSHKLPFHTNTITSSQPLEYLYTDVWTSPVLSIDNFKYYLIFVDHFTRYTWFYPLKQKSQVKETFIHFKALVEKHFDKPIKNLYSDTGGEYVALRAFLSAAGISHFTSPPHTPELQSPDTHHTGGCQNILV